MKLIVGLLVWVIAGALSGSLGDHFKGYDGCFALLDVDTGKWIRWNEKRCAQRFSPCSTFKIPNSLIGLEAGVVDDIDSMRTAFKESNVPYYQQIASKVGLEREADYVRRMHYGNEDTSGGVTKFWLASSLKISADEQCEFMRDYMLGKLPFSAANVAKVKEIMTVESDGTHTFGGKTGSDMDPKTKKRNFNWFVGFATNGNKRYVFATNISAPDIQGNKPAMQIAKAVLKDLGVL